MSPELFLISVRPGEVLKKSKEGSGSCVNAIREWQEVRPGENWQQTPKSNIQISQERIKTWK